MSGLPSGSWKRNGILAVRQPITAPVTDSTESPNSSTEPFFCSGFYEGAEYRLYFRRGRPA